MASTQLNKATNPPQLLMAASPGKLLKGGVDDDSLSLEFSEELTSLKDNKGKLSGKSILAATESQFSVTADGRQLDTEALPKGPDALDQHQQLPGKPVSVMNTPDSAATLNALTTGVPTKGRISADLPASGHSGNALASSTPGGHQPNLNSAKNSEAPLALPHTSHAKQGEAAQGTKAMLPAQQVTGWTNRDGKQTAKVNTKLADTVTSQQSLNNHQPATQFNMAKANGATTVHRPAVSGLESGELRSAIGPTLASDQNTPLNGNATRALPTSNGPANLSPPSQHHLLPDPANMATKSTKATIGRDATALRQLAASHAPAAGNATMPSTGMATANPGITSAVNAPVNAGSMLRKGTRQTGVSNQAVTGAQQAKRGAPAQRIDTEWSATTRTVEASQQSAQAISPGSTPGSSNAAGQVLTTAGTLPPSAAATQHAGSGFSVATELLEPMDAGLAQPEFSEQLVDRLSVMLRGPIGQASIRLSPEELGPVRIELNVEGQQASLRISAAHPETRAALDATLDDLREHFSQEGLELREARVQDEQHGSEYNGSSRRDMQQHPEPGYASTAGRTGSPADATPSEPQPVQAATHRPTDGRVNLVA